MNPIEQLKSVLCDQSGKCCISGSDEDRAIVDRALRALAQPAQEPSQDTLYLLRRLLSNQHTLTGSEFREELAKTVEAAYAAQPQLERTAFDTLPDDYETGDY